MFKWLFNLFASIEDEANEIIDEDRLESITEVEDMEETEGNFHVVTMTLFQRDTGEVKDVKRFTFRGKPRD